MLTSAADVLQDIAWKIVSQDWKYLAYHAWHNWLPNCVGLLVWAVSWWNITIRIDYTYWPTVVVITAGTLALGVFTGFGVMIAQEKILKRLGYENSMKGWDEEPPFPPDDPSQF